MGALTTALLVLFPSIVIFASVSFPLTSKCRLPFLDIVRTAPLPCSVISLPAATVTALVKVMFPVMLIVLVVPAVISDWSSVWVLALVLTVSASEIAVVLANSTPPKN
jgi:hypothetical protein